MTTTLPHLGISNPRALVASFLGRGVGFKPVIRGSQALPVDWKRYRKAQNARRAALGLTNSGKPRQRPHRDRGGLAKDHAAYMRVWRKERAGV